MGELAGAWSALEAEAEASIFVGWAWIGTWLRALPPAALPCLVRVQEAGRTIGLGLCARRTIWRHVFVRSRAIFLNATGDPALDEIAIEHNGFLARRGREHDVAQAARALLEHALADWDEFFLNGVVGPVDWGSLEAHGTELLTLRDGPSRFVDLARIRADATSYPDALGKSTRYNVRRSTREYAMLGPLQLEQARSLDEAREFFARLRALHQQYWVARGLPGAFANEFLVRFHERFIAEAFDEGHVQLLRVRAGESEIGYIYNLVHRRRVYNYQSGFQYPEGSQHLRPGLVAHVMAIEHNLAQGMDVYDFLAGDSRFKQSLATAQAPMAWQVVRRDRVLLRVEDALRDARRQLLKRASADPQPATADS
jgi:CelD/BcsL family acetyltransferase involved in cellulose biosynthesis